MERENTLTERIVRRLEEHRQDLAGKQQQLDSRMKELLEQRERLKMVAKGKIEKLVLPRMEELARQFDNAEVEVLHTDAGYHCICKFAHTPRFPATVRLGIALSPGCTDHLTVRYDVNILPVLMEYSRNFEEVFSLEDDDYMAGWVEDRILDFIDTYLRLETHPLYQKDNAVIDVVCGMHISLVSAASTVERDGKTFFFCSEHCRDTFLKGRD
jgi:YHS domain-containing protein